MESLPTQALTDQPTNVGLWILEKVKNLHESHDSFVVSKWW